MTYKDLLRRLQSLTEEQLRCNLACELILSEECFSSVEGDFEFNIAGLDNNYLDNNHPVFTLKY